MQYFLDNIQSIRQSAYDGRMIICDYFKERKKDNIFDEIEMNNGDLLIRVFQNDYNGKSFLDNFCKERLHGGWVDGVSKQAYINSEVCGDVVSYLYNRSIASFKYNIFDRKVRFMCLNKNNNIQTNHEFSSIEEYNSYSIKQQVLKYYRIKKNITDRLNESVNHLNTINFTGK